MSKLFRVDLPTIRPVFAKLRPSLIRLPLIKLSLNPVNHDSYSDKPGRFVWNPLAVKPRVIFPVLLLLITSLILAACGISLPGVSWFGGGTTSSPFADVVMLQVDMYDSYYGTTDDNLTNPPIWTVQTGADVVVNIVNHGILDHNWAVIKQGTNIPVPYEEGQGGDIVLHGVGMVYNNSQTTITFTAPEAGEYQVICTVSGHYPFMQGKLQVVE